MSATIGIDLGTTNSCVAVYRDGDAEVVPNSEGSRTTPSVVAFTEDGERLVGQVAKRQRVTNAENTIIGAKRLIGRKYDDQTVREARERVPYEIVEADSGDAWVRARGDDYSPPEISAIVLREIREVAEDYLGEEVTDAVITVPAYFDDAQRQATEDAGTIAGLDVTRIVNEPTAAALAFGFGVDGDDDGEQTIAVYDLGGGTFDISILELADGVFSVLSTSGDTFLGGEDFDNAIVDLAADRFEQEHGVDLRRDDVALQRLKEEAENAKCELSSCESVELHLPFIHSTDDGPIHLEQTLDRDSYEALVEDLVRQTEEPCRRALADSGLDPVDIDTVLLVGGMTRMPMVERRVAHFFDTDPEASVNPDEVVASGAALQAAVARGQLQEVLLLDVTPLTLGIETKGGQFEPVIDRNTTIPCSQSKVFTTAEDNQEMVRVHVAQGERATVEDNRSLATFELTGIPPAPRGVPEIEVRFEIDENGMVDVTARDAATETEKTVNVIADGGLSDDQIEEMIEEADEHAEEDRRLSERSDLQNEAEGLLYSTQRTFESYGDQLPEEERVEIEEDLATVESLVDDASIEELETMIESLESTAHRLAEVMYDSADGPGTGGEDDLEGESNPDAATAE